MEQQERLFDKRLAQDQQLIDRTNVNEATRRAVSCGVLTDQAGSYHATALGHRYIKWMN